MKKPALVIAVGEKKKPRKNYVEPPEEFDLPKVEVGETFEFVAEVTRKKDGYCISAWDGIPVDGEKDDVEEEKEETLGEGARNAMKGYV